MRLSSVYKCIHIFRKYKGKFLYTFSYTSLLQDLFSFAVYKCIHFIFFIILYYIDFFIIIIIIILLFYLLN